MDEATGAWYEVNSVTGDSRWCTEDVEDGKAVDDTPSGDDYWQLRFDPASRAPYFLRPSDGHAVWAVAEPPVPPCPASVNEWQYVQHGAHGYMSNRYNGVTVWVDAGSQ